MDGSHPLEDTAAGVIAQMLSQAHMDANSYGSTQQHPTYHRIIIDGDDGSKDYAKCAEMIARIIQSRSRYKDMDKGDQEDPFTVDPSTGNVSYIDAETGLPTSTITLSYKGGIFSFSGMQTTPSSYTQYNNDVKAVYRAIEFGPCLSAARMRLTTLQEKFQLYSLLNTELEENYDPVSRGGGVYANCTKVDNALHLFRSMTAPTLLEFIKKTALERPRTPLLHSENGEIITLRQYLEEEGGISDPSNLTVEGLGLHPPLFRNKFQEYNIFDERLNPAGRFGSNFFQALLTMHGPNDGDLVGMLIRPEMEKREFQQHLRTATELQIPICGHNEDELRKLASWVRRQGFNSFHLNCWTLSILRTPPPSGPNALPITCKTVSDQLHNIFFPMFMATLYPDDPMWCDVATLLNVTGTVTIETEAMRQQESTHDEEPNLDSVPFVTHVSDKTFFYYVWVNLTALNALRARHRLNTLRFCPGVLEAPPNLDQLVSSFLLADAVYHARSLERSWIMQYLYLYCRVGVVMCPLRDNTVYKSYFDHPVVRYFKQGFLISISTSECLHYHHSQSGLTEEYATLLKLHNLTGMDLCELARNSVINSGFSMAMKQRWLGDSFHTIGSQGNDVSRSCLCDFRLQFRHECLLHEETVLNLMLAQVAKPGTEPLKVNVIPFSRSMHISDVMKQFRNIHKLNYADRRIVYPRIDIFGGSEVLGYSAEAARTLQQVVDLRKKYTTVQTVDVQVEDVFDDTNFDESLWEFNNYYGVFLVSRIGRPPPWPRFIPPIKHFIQDVGRVRHAVMGNSNLRQLALARLNLLEHKFLLHQSLNMSKEAGKKEEKELNNRDFFTAHKVDNNVQTDAGMNARTLLEFFVEKALNNGHDIVFEEDRVPITLRQLLERLEINVARITVDEMNYLINNNQEIRDIFLSTDNFMQGRYFAELTKCTLELYKEDEFCFSENRLVVYGKSVDEWQQLAHWFDRHGMASSQNRWMVNLPRGYRRLRQKGAVRNFGEYLENIFKPLWDSSLHPAQDTKFHYFLTHVSGFDCIDDESRIDLPLSETFPHDWDSELNPPYNMYMYYLWANITTLNKFRASRGLGTFAFRPQCGEQGVVDHLIGGFLLANSINHGVVLAQNPVLEYMYYLAQISIAMSPLSNTDGASEYLQNPFPLFFHRGLNVSLATNRPLYFHFTREPLIEEYSIAAKLWQFEFNDLSEIARNSVLQSGFPHAWKQNALGELYRLNSTLGNDVRKSRLSDIRVAYRYEVYHTEINFLDKHLPEAMRMPRAMHVLEDEIREYEETLQVKLAYPNEWEDSLSADGKEKDGSTATATAAGSADFTDGGDASNPDNKVAVAKNTLLRIKLDIEELEQQLSRTNVLMRHLSAENGDVAATINRLRAKLQTEGLVVSGNLATLDAPLSPPKQQQQQQPSSSSAVGGTEGGAKR